MYCKTFYESEEEAKSCATSTEFKGKVTGVFVVIIIIILWSLGYGTTKRTVIVGLIAAVVGWYVVPGLSLIDPVAKYHRDELAVNFKMSQMGVTKDVARQQLINERRYKRYQPQSRTSIGFGDNQFSLNF